MVNLEVIKTLNPCKDRLDNYVKFYENKSFTKRHFMGLKNISHQNKLWVAFRLMPKEKVRLATADIAELVLPVFESKYPNDNRPRLAIEAARNLNLSSSEIRNAAYAAYAAAAAQRSGCAGAKEKTIRTIVLKYWK